MSQSADADDPDRPAGEPEGVRRLGIYTDASLKTGPGDPSSLLVPFLLDPVNLARRSHSPYWQYWQEADELFRLTGPEDCDFAMLPFDWSEVRLGDTWVPKTDRAAGDRARRFFDEADSFKRPVVVFFSSERSNEPLPRAGLKVFRRSLFRSRRTPNDFVLPAFPPQDMLADFFDGRVPLRQKSARPTVGFCGFAREKTILERARELPYHLTNLARTGHPDVSPYHGIALRTRCVERLQASPRVDTNFLLRGDHSFFRSTDPAVKQRLRDEFGANMRDSDYVLCCRGSSNFSFRLYETLASGRIPVFVDTDSVLPFEGEIDWHSLCVRVKEGELAQIGERVAAFHDALSPDDFEALQLRCRAVYERWLTPHGFFRNIHRLIA